METKDKGRQSWFSSILVPIKHLAGGVMFAIVKLFCWPNIDHICCQKLCRRKTISQPLEPAPVSLDIPMQTIFDTSLLATDSPHIILMRETRLPCLLSEWKRMVNYYVPIYFMLYQQYSLN